MSYIPNPDDVFPNDYGTSCFIKNVISAPNIIVGDYTYYDDPEDPTGFERNNVLFNYPEFGDKLITSTVRSSFRTMSPITILSWGTSSSSASSAPLPPAQNSSWGPPTIG